MEQDESNDQPRYTVVMEPSVVFYQVLLKPVVYFLNPIICWSLGKCSILAADIKAVKTSRLD